MRTGVHIFRGDCYEILDRSVGETTLKDDKKPAKYPVGRDDPYTHRHSILLVITAGITN